MKRVVSQRETLTALPVWGRKSWNINIRFYISFSLLKELKRRAQKAVGCFKQRPAQTHLFMKMTRISSWILAAVPARWRPVRPVPAWDWNPTTPPSVWLQTENCLWEKFTHPLCVSVLDEGVFVGLIATRAGLSCCVFACVEVLQPQAVNNWHKAGWSRNSRSRHVLILNVAHVSTSGVKCAE